MSQYASSTTVSPDKTKMEIEQTLHRYKATSFASGWDGNKASVAFRLENRSVRFVINLPAPSEKRFTHRMVRGYSKAATPQQALEAWEQAVRQKWRSLLLRIKAKLESWEDGDEPFDSAFMANIVLPDGSTIGETLIPQLEEVCHGREPLRLLALPAPERNGSC